MGLIEDLLGCPLQQITRSYWAVKLTTGEWLCEARVTRWIPRGDKHRIDSLPHGQERHFDWTLDLVSTGDVKKVTQLWLLCPPSKTSPLGNTARLDISEPGTAFQFKIATADSSIASPATRTLQAHIIGKVIDKLTGTCECYIYDPVEDGMITPETQIFDPVQGVRRDAAGEPIYAGRTNVYNFHSWRPSLAPPGRLHLDMLGVSL
jgi:hypothetical protein